MAAELSRRVVSSTQTWPGAAADWTRDAVFTGSPATMPCISAPTDGHLAGHDADPHRPIRDADLRAQGSDGRHQLEPRADRTLGIVLVRGRNPPLRHHGVT